MTNALAIVLLVRVEPPQQMIRARQRNSAKKLSQLIRSNKKISSVHMILNRMAIPIIVSSAIPSKSMTIKVDSALTLAAIIF